MACSSFAPSAPPPARNRRQHASEQTSLRKGSSAAALRSFGARVPPLLLLAAYVHAGHAAEPGCSGAAFVVEMKKSKPLALRKLAPLGGHLRQIWRQPFPTEWVTQCCSLASMLFAQVCVSGCTSFIFSKIPLTDALLL